jgi:diacylglycerol O-acyltransferase / wax synthase
VRVRVPASLHSEADDAGNRDSFFSVALPLNEADPIARLKAVHAATHERKIDHDAETMDELMRDLAKISPRLERFAARVEQSPRRFAVNVSNVPGPRTPVTVLGSPLDTLYSIAEIGERHALRVAVVSACGRLGFGFCADPAIVEDLAEMARGVEVEAAILTA